MFSLKKNDIRVIDDIEANLHRVETALASRDAEINAITKSFATIEFDVSGHVLDANDAFLRLMEYSRDEVVGKHHRIFVRPDDVNSAEYRDFWASLRSGVEQTKQWRRVSKTGRDIFIQASYMPVFDNDGNVVKIIKFASDMTDQTNDEFLHRGILESISQAQAVVEYKPDGTVITANEKFLRLMGYGLAEIEGRHHRIFIDKDHSESDDYKMFWNRLASGETQVATYKRLRKDQSPVYIQASYTPVNDINGKTVRVVNSATDVTTHILLQERMQNTANVLADSSKQMSGSITGGVNETAELAGQTEILAKNSKLAVSDLDQKSREIEKVVEVIQDLADQTNLLALNAQIESARAGDAGRGFAVVANEVKTLANQTTESAKSIESTVADIQARIREVVEATDGITLSVGDVNSKMTSISAALKTQSVTMDELSQEAADLLR